MCVFKYMALYGREQFVSVLILYTVSFCNDYSLCMHINFIKLMSGAPKLICDENVTLIDIETRQVECGVPHGSMFGPLINDLPDAIDNVRFIIFAEVTTIFLSRTNTVRVFQTNE